MPLIFLEMMEDPAMHETLPHNFKDIASVMTRLPWFASFCLPSKIKRRTAKQDMHLSDHVAARESGCGLRQTS
jgi:hypothetical protein